jgi:polyferredoxin
MESIQYSSQPLTFHREAPPPVQAGRARKQVVRRRGDRVQLLRHSVQVAFLLLNLWIGAQFYFFVRYFETGGRSAWVPRPPGVEGWLPIAGLMNLKYALLSGRVPAVHPAGLFLLLSFGAMSFVFRKAFCSWLCPIGTISEWLWQGGRELVHRTFALPRRVDVPLRGLKYLLLGLFVFAIARMSAADLIAFMTTPYGLVADVKMLNFFRSLGQMSALVIASLLVLSMFVKNAWCRYLCPYGALMGLIALVSPARIRRDPIACIDCGKCAKACPSLLPVDRRLTVTSAECTGCLECVSACPVQGALDLRMQRRVIPGWAVAAGLALLFFGLVGLARWTGHWHSNISIDTYRELVPNASQFEHPGV